MPAGNSRHSTEEKKMIKEKARAVATAGIIAASAIATPPAHAAPTGTSPTGSSIGHIQSDPPDRLRASHVASNSINITFVDGSTNEDYFFVDYRVKNGDWHPLWQARTQSKKSMGLKYSIYQSVGRNTIYCYRAGTLQWKGLSLVRSVTGTYCDAPAAPSTPANSRVTRISSSSVSIKFDRSSKWEWGYQLCAKRAGSAPWVYKGSLVVRTAKDTYIMTANNLKPNRFYRFIVVPYNQFGAGTASDDVTATTVSR
jgi:hypothetical protein